MYFTLVERFFCVFVAAQTFSEGADAVAKLASDLADAPAAKEQVSPLVYQALTTFTCVS
jgi:hypothetical protein